MPIAYTILHAPDVLLVSYQGVVTNEEFLTGYKAAYADPFYKPGMHEISDMRYMDVFDIDMVAIQDLVTWIADRDELAGATIRVGILQRSELHEGLARLYAAVSDIYKKETVQLFRDLPDILAWLPVEAAHAGRIASALDALYRVEAVSAGHSGSVPR